MPRPVKCRRIESLPQYTYFLPVGRKKCELEEIVLKVEELEAIELKDIEELNQEECAERMEVSRQTFQNIIDSARKKVALALVEGKAININGGNYGVDVCQYECKACGFTYEVKREDERKTCPSCGLEKVVCIRKNIFCKKQCKRNI